MLTATVTQAVQASSTIDTNTVLTSIVLIFVGAIGFYIKQMGNKLDKMMPKETCDILHTAHDKEHVALQKDIDGIAKIKRGK